MEIQDTLTAAADALVESNISFALIGGFALAAHGVVRATQDIDLLVDGKKKEQAKATLLKKGFSVQFENDEVMHLTGLGQLDCLFANRPMTQAMLARAVKINEFPVPVVLAEDIIGLKIQAYSNDSMREFQDKADIQALMEANELLNFDQVKIYADMFDQWDFIQALRSKL